MSGEPKPRAKVEMGDESVLPPPKPVNEMSDDEKKKYREDLLHKLEEGQAAGGEAKLDIILEDAEFNGTITMKRPTMDQQREIGVRAAKYLQGVAGVDLRTDNLALFFATFDVCVDWNSAPAWFKPREMFDYRLLEHVYGRWADWLKTFREFIPLPPPGDSEAK